MPLQKPISAEHFHIVLRALPDALGFDQLVHSLQKISRAPPSRLQFPAMRSLHLFTRHNIVGGRIDGHMLQLGPKLSRQGIDLADPVNFVPEKFHTDDVVIRLAREKSPPTSPRTRNLLRIKLISLRSYWISTSLSQKVIPAFLHPWAQRNYHGAVINRIAQTIDAGYASHNDYIPPLGQSAGGANGAAYRSHR